MRGDDDFFTRGQMCLSLLQTACLPALAAVAPALERATRAHCGAGARSPSHFTDPTNLLGAPQTLAQIRASSACLAAAKAVLSLAPARTGRSAVQ